MFQQIRNSKATKAIIWYLVIMLSLEITHPMQLYALTEGPSQPEFNSFTPIGTSDMVDLASGDFNYNIPIMDVGGYPINLAYNSGVTMDQEASWVGLGWNLNIGQINRDVRGLPDDFKGDEIKTEDNLKDNLTVGIRPYINFQIVGMEDQPQSGSGLGLSSGIDIQYNNYSGISATTSFGASYQVSQNVGVGINLSSSQDNGVNVTPSISLSTNEKKQDQTYNKFSGSISPSITYNSRQGLQSFNFSSNFTTHNKFTYKDHCGDSQTGYVNGKQSGSAGISFANTTFTPSKRLSLKNDSFEFSFSFGGDVYGFHIEGSTAAYASLQKLTDPVRFHKAYGYENTEWANEKSLLDFNREKEQPTVSKHSIALSATNYTYDVYSVHGQDISGQFRPYRGQIGYVFDAKVVDKSSSNTLGAEVEAGQIVHIGGNFKNIKTKSHTGSWSGAPAVDFFEEKMSGNLMDYERVYLKNPGETKADIESQGMLNEWLGGQSPVTLKLDGGGRAINNYQKKISGSEATLANANVATGNFGGPLKRNHREKRNQVTQKITVADVEAYSLDQSFFKVNPHAKTHHTAGYIITDNNGRRNIYGETAYNIEKREVSFAVGGNSVNCNTGSVSYGGGDNSTSNSKGRDNYFNRTTTPAYAHTYLLTSVLSTDYEDITGNGPTDDDLGSYTKFVYTDDEPVYKWRVPYERYQASYNEGLKTDHGANGDQKGSYLYGRKENKYLKRIETKTHVAFIDLEDRHDGRGVQDEDGGYSASAAKMKCITSIRLYSKPELPIVNGIYADPGITSSVKPIKTAHFKYKYSLMSGPDLPNNPVTSDPSGNGKLTLDKVFFTYKSSNMGMYAPYKFSYSNNYPYNFKNYDIWGNYMVNPSGACAITSGDTTPQEFPYVDQTNRPAQDAYAAAWSLSSIQLPSGGTIQLEYESDDYKYVQDKKAMQMLKVAGVVRKEDEDDEVEISDITDHLYGDGGHADYVVVKIHPSQVEPIGSQDPEEYADNIIKKFTQGLVGEPVHFNFLLQMKDQDYDFVPGYFIMGDKIKYASDTSGQYLFIPMKRMNREGKDSAQDLENPIAVRGWTFARKYLNRYMYNDYDTNETDVVALAEAISGSMEEMLNIFKGPNKVLQDKNAVKYFKPAKSWIRLLNPTGSKIGGGLRVKSVKLYDQWDKMLPVTSNLDRYAKQYGQEYEYDLDDGTSSGVATYEPNMSKENPLVQPLVARAERLSGDVQEKPFGESFFPAPTVTYSRVIVKNIPANSQDTRTGSVVTEHYTSRDFPTIADYTPLDKSKNFDSNENEILPNLLKSTLGLPVDAHNKLHLSQGFCVTTNDMNGKVKKREVFSDNNSLISSVQYKYSATAAGNQLANHIKVIDASGKVSDQIEVGVEYDIINDFRESYSKTTSLGVNTNVDVMVFGVYPVVMGMFMPERQTHLNTLQTVATTKVIHKTGILTETIAKDLGSTVSTRNLAWDADTGQVLLTETKNEFDDKYYSLNFPSRWYYKDMGLASENIDLVGEFSVSTSPSNPLAHYGIDGISDLSKIFNLGDELVIDGILPLAQGPQEISELGQLDPVPLNSSYAWVVAFTSDKSRVALMNRKGIFYNPCGDIARRFRVIRSGKRNLQMSGMASISAMANPLDHLTSNGYLDLSVLEAAASLSKIVNASAITYKDFWRGQEENSPFYPFYRYDLVFGNKILEDGSVMLNMSFGINPYVFNIKGDWRADKSYAFLTGRNSTSFGTNNNPRNIGFFKSFSPFYTLDGGQWIKEVTGWTHANTVTKFHPSGMELENKDALGRFQSAQYGYFNKLPMAVAANSSYGNMFYEGFEEQYGNDRARFANLAEAITVVQSHTGRKSIYVKAGESVHIAKKLVEQFAPKPKVAGCGTSSTVDDSPSSAIYNGTVCAVNGIYDFTIDVDFGQNEQNETTPVIFCPQGDFTYSVGQIHYISSNPPPPTIIILKDSDGDCRRAHLSAQLVGPGCYHVQSHPGVSDCSCF